MSARGHVGMGTWGQALARGDMLARVMGTWGETALKGGNIGEPDDWLGFI